MNLHLFKTRIANSLQLKAQPEQSLENVEPPNSVSSQSDLTTGSLRPSLKPPHIHAIGGFRFIAAMAVMLCHFRGKLGFGDFNPAFGGRGVSFFFVLSGFILTYVYRERLTPQGILSFYYKRIIRLWPLHLVCLAISIWLLGSKVFLAKLAITVLLLQSWTTHSSWIYQYNGVSWSISTEMFFFFAFPFLLLGGQRQFWIKLGVIAISTLGMMYVIQYLRYNAEIPSHIDLLQIVHCNPLMRLVEFCIGMATAFLFLNSIDRRRNLNAAKENQTRELPSKSPKSRQLLWDTAKELAAISMFALFVLTYDQVRHLLATSDWAGKMFSAWYHFSGSCFAFAIIIYVFANSKGILARMMGSRLMNSLGEVSYAFFLIHITIIIYHHRFDWSASNTNRWWMAIWLFVLVLGLAILLHRVVEKPISDGLAAFSKRGFKSSILIAIKQINQFVFSKASAACLVLCLGGWLGLWSQYVPIKSLAMHDLIAASPEEFRDIEFGKTIRMLGCDAKATAKGIRLRFVWQKVRPTKHFRFTHLMDEHNKVIKIVRADKMLFRKAELFHPFLETYLIPNKFLADAKQIGIGFYCAEIDPATNKAIGTLAKHPSAEGAYDGRLIVVGAKKLHRLKKEIKRTRSPSVNAKNL